MWQNRGTVNPKHVASFMAIVASFGVLTDAAAEDVGLLDTPTITTVAPMPRLFAVDGALGSSAQAEAGAWMGSAQIAATAVGRVGWLTTGFSGEFDGHFGAPNEEFFGVLAGSTWNPTSAVRIDALGEFGAHLGQLDTAWTIFGTRNIVAGDRSFALPYAGIRLSPAFLIGSGRHARFLIGIWLAVREDLSRTTAHYDVESCGVALLGGDACSRSAESYRAGGLQLGAGLRFGVEFGPTLSP